MIGQGPPIVELVDVGRGTPMGNLMREYWVPALPSAEFPEPDCPPKRMMLLAAGEADAAICGGAGDWWRQFQYALPLIPLLGKLAPMRTMAWS